MTGRGSQPRPFSFVRLALLALGAGALVLLISVPIILLVARWSVIAGLVVALIAIVAIVAAIGVVAQRIVGQAEQQLRDQRANQPNHAQRERNDNGG